MKSIFLFPIAVGLLLFLPAYLKAQPEFKSDVQKEYDENGNITRFDSCWSWSHNGGAGFDFDTVFSRFFQHSLSHPKWDNFFDDFHGMNRDSIFSSPFPEPFFYGENLDDFFKDFPAFPDFDDYFREHKKLLPSN